MPEKGCYICLPDQPTEGLEDPCDACEADWIAYYYAAYGSDGSHESDAS